MALNFINLNKFILKSIVFQVREKYSTTIYYVRHKAEMHENRRFFSTGMEFAKNAHAYVLKAPSRS